MTVGYVHHLPGLRSGQIVTRYKRFLADVVLDDGEQVTAHCPNTGSMKGCWKPGAPVQLSFHDKPGRKLKYTLERVDMGCGWVGVNTSVVNHVILGAVKSGDIPYFSGYKSVRSEPPYLAPGYPKSRFDLFLEQGNQPPAYVEVKNTTLLEGNAIRFPDAVTDRGRKHLELLAHASGRGYRAAILFAVNRPEGDRFEPARHIDPEYADTLERVVAGGVEAIAVRLRHVKDGISVGSSFRYAG